MKFEKFAIQRFGVVVAFCIMIAQTMIMAHKNMEEICCAWQQYQ
ncbi:hypothetical protein [Zunongwangia sp. H14]